MRSFSTEPASCVLCDSTEGNPEASGIDYVYGGSDQPATAWRCAQCGHVYLNPRPVPDSVGVLYPANYASFSGKFTESSGLLARLKERVMLGRIRPYLEALPPDAAFLDVGCGDGQLLEAVKRNFPQLHVHGLDWHFEPALRRRLEALGIVLHETTLESARLPQAHFGLVTMNQLIEHLWQPRECLRSVAQSLAPNGQLLLTTPDLDGYDRALFRSGLWGGYYFPRHLNLFSRSRLMQLLVQCGFQPVECRNLVAPVVWCYSLKAWTRVRFPRLHWLHRSLDVHNIPLLALATIADRLAMLLGLHTSNQVCVARVDDQVPGKVPGKAFSSATVITT